jgi:hypothetical protein
MLDGLGKLVYILSRPISEIIGFILIFTLFQIVIMGLTIEKEFFSNSFGINPLGIVFGFLISFSYYDSYSDGMQTKFNKHCLNIFPKSYIFKYFTLYFMELIGIKIGAVVSVIIAISCFNYFSEENIISFQQFINLFSFIIIMYLFINNIILILKLIWRVDNKILNYIIIHGLIGVIILLYKFFLSFIDLFEKQYGVALLKLILAFLILNQLFYLLFKRIITSDSIFKK